MTIPVEQLGFIPGLAAPAGVHTPAFPGLSPAPTQALTLSEWAFNAAFVDVKTYGAVGDGDINNSATGTDNFTAITNAIAALASFTGPSVGSNRGGGTLYFPPGIYRVSAPINIGVFQYLKIIGAGRGRGGDSLVSGITGNFSGYLLDHNRPNDGNPPKWIESLVLYNPGGGGIRLIGALNSRVNSCDITALTYCVNLGGFANAAPGDYHVAVANGTTTLQLTWVSGQINPISFPCPMKNSDPNWPPIVLLVAGSFSNSAGTYTYTTDVAVPASVAVGSDTQINPNDPSAFETVVTNCTFHGVPDRRSTIFGTYTVAAATGTNNVQLTWVSGSIIDPYRFTNLLFDHTTPAHIPTATKLNSGVASSSAGTYTYSTNNIIPASAVGDTVYISQPSNWFDGVGVQMSHHTAVHNCSAYNLQAGLRHYGAGGSVVSWHCESSTYGIQTGVDGAGANAISDHPFFTCLQFEGCYSALELGGCAGAVIGPCISLGEVDLGVGPPTPNAVAHCSTYGVHCTGATNTLLQGVNCNGTLQADFGVYFVVGVSWNIGNINCQYGSVQVDTSGSITNSTPVPGSAVSWLNSDGFGAWGAPLGTAAGVNSGVLYGQAQSGWLSEGDERYITDATSPIPGDIVQGGGSYLVRAQWTFNFADTNTVNGQWVAVPSSYSPIPSNCNLWDSTHAYVLGDIVIAITTDKNFYRAIASTTNNEPSVSTTKWVKIQTAAKGMKTFVSNSNTATFGNTMTTPVSTNKLPGTFDGTNWIVG